ncbi:hypothetical protein CROQUDRAFT_653888 [Cronartium quercuum f. sp. fusiforme G11]|uniref:YTH domain-containing protein n=1 Tax=Cronartium quercuum f. sp. fusiforme G11 TaxID=708437 RepID=A0A9P6NS42_9BASI|nr:hypothetical protein CROQUDRAFT_653888 [Cronartium quercuum f. sp. fusiforme G11]
MTSSDSHPSSIDPSNLPPPPPPNPTTPPPVHPPPTLASPVRLDQKISGLPLSSSISPDSLLPHHHTPLHFSPTHFQPVMSSPPGYPLPHSPPIYPYPPQSYYHPYNGPYSPSSTHSRQLSNPTSVSSIPPPLTIQPTPYSASIHPNPLSTPTYAPAPYYLPPAPSNYPQPNYHPSQPQPPPSSHSSHAASNLISPGQPFSAYSPNFGSPPPGTDQTAYAQYPTWHEPYPTSSPSYEPAYQHGNMPYLAFRDQPISPPADSAYPLAFSPSTSQIPNHDSYQRTYREHAHASPSPLHSPYTSPGPHTPHTFRSPHRPPVHHHHPHPSPRYGSFAHRPAFSSGSSPPIHGPKSPTSPPVVTEALVRGSLAQAKLRNHHLIKRNTQTGPEPIPITTRHSSTAIGTDKIRHPKPLQRPALPRPPSHSEHALWVGNVPNDASHEELWKFFAGPPTTGSPQSPTSAGVESIHLISRSNCAFVNYLSDDHLQQAILACNGKSLRAFDPRCKPLVCRVRKVEDNVKSGVGAQRIGGMHRSWVRKTQPAPPPLPPALSAPVTEDAFKRTSSASTFHSNGTASAGTASTSSSFLAKHFPRRYFILKSYTEDDLKLSVERSVWASQSHNEPVLDQAFRTSSEGVYLIFSANRSGEFFGYARMAGPIWRPVTRPASVPASPISRPSLGARRASASGSLEHEHEVPELLLPAFECSRVATASPAPLSDIEGLVTPSVPPSNARSLPEPVRAKEQGDGQEGAEAEVEEGGGGSDADSASGTSGRPFEVEWIKVRRLAFHLTRDLKNPFNGHREVKVSRDGTEIEPGVGAELVARIEGLSVGGGGGVGH